jgi:pimeloyl-ACP methyl ester carboxylesterase
VRFLVVLSGPAVSVGLEIRHGRLTAEGSRPVADDELAREMAALPGPHGYDPAETLRRLRTPTLWIMGDRDTNLPLPDTLRALQALPATRSGLLTLVRFADADHAMLRPDGSRVDYWASIETWLAARGILARGPRR